MAKGKQPKVAKTTIPTTVTPASAPPNWPVFKPPLPVVDLTLDVLVKDKVVVYRNFWPQSLCRDYVSFLKTLPLTTTPGKPKRGEAVRVNDRYQITDQRFADRLWLETGLEEAVLAEGKGQKWYVHGCRKKRDESRKANVNRKGWRSRWSESQYQDLPIFQGAVLRLPL